MEGVPEFMTVKLKPEKTSSVEDIILINSDFSNTKEPNRWHATLHPAGVELTVCGTSHPPMSLYCCAGLYNNSH